ncbi:MAG: hypothetical protein V4482_03230, partial [Pseudomonadota bacterium]
MKFFGFIRHAKLILFLEICLTASLVLNFCEPAWAVNESKSKEETGKKSADTTSGSWMDAFKWHGFKQDAVKQDAVKQDAVKQD